MADSKDDGGSAFPFHHVYANGDAREDFGMALRDYFAGQALAHAVHNADVHFKNAARIAYQIADALIAERKK